MDAKIYWVGEKPGGAMIITVLDSTGTPANLSQFTSARLRMLDADNHEVYADPSQTQISNPATGRVVFAWPTNRSLFTEPGEYVLQLELSTATAKRYTSVQDILVKELGGVR